MQSEKVEARVRIVERVLLGAVLGPVPPILGLLAAWWGSFVLLSEDWIITISLAGLLIGLAIDVFFLKRWVEHAYAIDLKVWMVIYLFYSAGMFGFFMGVPVFNVLLAVPAGFFIGAKLAQQAAGALEIRRLTLQACIFTTGVMVFVCAASAAFALWDAHTGANLKGMLGLPFQVTRPMLVAIILIGGFALVSLQWGLTGIAARLMYRLMRLEQTRRIAVGRP